jgi:hypothetical protein
VNAYIAERVDHCCDPFFHKGCATLEMVEQQILKGEQAQMAMLFKTEIRKSQRINWLGN